MRCYQNKMYNTLPDSVVVDAESGYVPNALHMSGNSADPSYLNIASVDAFHAQPMCGVVLLYMSITAVKTRVKPNKER